MIRVERLEDAHSISRMGIFELTVMPRQQYANNDANAGHNYGHQSGCMLQRNHPKLRLVQSDKRF